ncbi:GDSL-type esterase/lipase family protein [Pontibacter actiniarum]|uniref:Sialate O-acetylesterase n=1 Tax=Pontibacter actiniarum TaxID=323450 RepID=A0A1X9YY20_9BACT|nr:GDSL-type esterase/lipase family protein [Pontibacter actiniarum]ARS37827.1 sialate O-acetylesterase [Pontibacter actiniarum]
MKRLSRLVKGAFAFACVLWGTSAAVAQEAAAWDSTYRPSTYQVQVDQFRAYPNSRKDIVFLGNSITAHPNWNELLGLKNARNRGISGDITYGVLERLDEVTEGKPAKVFLLIGINDISRNIPDSLILQNYKKIVRRVKTESPSTKLYIQTILPTNNTFTKFKKHYNKEEHVFWLNEALKQLAADENVTLIDLYPAFTDGEGRLVEAYTHDGLHLTHLGYQKWAELLQKGKYLK